MVSDNLPVLHPSEYADPLEADSRQEAVGVVNSQGILMAIGDETTQEWLRMESEEWGYPVRR